MQEQLKQLTDQNHHLTTQNQMLQAELNPGAQPNELQIEGMPHQMPAAPGGVNNKQSSKES